MAGTVGGVFGNGSTNWVNPFDNSGSGSEPVVTPFGTFGDGRIGNFGPTFNDIYKWDKGLNAYNAEFSISSALAAMQFTHDEGKLDREFQAESAEKAMQFEADQAELNRKWQERMSNTAYQRAMEDMLAAGLNPILAYNQGGASTPTAPSVSGFSAIGSNSARGYQAMMSNKRDIISIGLNALSNMFASSASLIGRLASN